MTKKQDTEVITMPRIVATLQRKLAKLEKSIQLKDALRDRQNSVIHDQMEEIRVQKKTLRIVVRRGDEAAAYSRLLQQYLVSITRVKNPLKIEAFNTQVLDALMYWQDGGPGG